MLTGSRLLPIKSCFLPLWVLVVGLRKTAPALFPSSSVALSGRLARWRAPLSFGCCTQGFNPESRELSTTPPYLSRQQNRWGLTFSLHNHQCKEKSHEIDIFFKDTFVFINFKLRFLLLCYFIVNIWKPFAWILKVFIILQNILLYYPFSIQVFKLLRYFAYRTLPFYKYVAP